ncbi:MAG: hypothetical protein K6G63_04575 [Eubacterium sp.]|nr:hypothetical protein [Eubacterium sp.]
MKMDWIELIAKVGKKRKILMYPLLGIYIICVTISHLFKKIFFEAGTHRVRVRALVVLTSLALIFITAIYPTLANGPGNDDNVILEGNTASGGAISGNEDDKENQDNQDNGDNNDQNQGEQDSNQGSADSGNGDGNGNEKEDGDSTPRPTETPEPIEVAKPNVRTITDSITATYGKIAMADHEMEVEATPGDETEGVTLSYTWYIRNADGGAGQAVGDNTKAKYVLPENIQAGEYRYYCEVVATLKKGKQVATASKKSDDITVNIEKAPLQPVLNSDPSSVLDYSINDKIYNGADQGISVNKTENYKNIGNVNVYYAFNGSDTATTTAGNQVGTREVYVTIDESRNYAAASDKVSLGTYTVSYWNPDGKYSVEGEVAGTDKDGNEWYNKDVIIRPPSGCLISKSENEFKETLVLTQGKQNLDGIYLQKIPESYISEKISIDKVFNIDTTPPTGKIVFSGIDGADESPIVSSKQLSGTVNASDSLSGVKSVHLYYTTDSKVDCKALPESAWIEGRDFDIAPTENDSTNYYVYAKLVDYAGNVGYLSNENITIDAVKPEIALDGAAIDGSKRCVAYKKQVDVSDVNLETVNIRRSLTESGSAESASDAVVPYTIKEKDGKKHATFEIVSPKDTGSVYKYYITGLDSSGNTTYVEIAMVDPITDVNAPELDFGSKEYGYTGGEEIAKGFDLTRAGLYNEENDPIVTGLTILDEEGTTPEAFKIVDSTKIAPVDKLHVGTYRARVKIAYNTDSEILSTCVFNVKKAHLNAVFPETDIWYYTTNIELDSKINVTGFVYGETTETAKDYVAPKVDNYEGQSATVGSHVMTISGGKAADYDMAYTTGYINVKKRVLADYNVLGNKGDAYNGEDGVNWYTSPTLTIEPKTGFALSKSDDPSSFTLENIPIETDRDLSSETFFLKNIQTGEISDKITFRYAKDSTPPTGKINVEKNSIKGLLNTITLGNFFAENIDVDIDAEDDLSGIKGVYYYKSEGKLSGDELSRVTGWEEGDSLSLTASENSKITIYAKVVNGAGLVTYLSSDELVFDTEPPVISNVEDGGEYTCDSRKIMVSDASLYDVVVYEGTDTTSGNGKRKFVDDNSSTCDFLISSDDDETVCTVVAEDRAGNKSKKTFKIIKATYEATVEDIVLPDLIYGHKVNSGKTIKLKDNGNASAKITDVTVYNEDEFEVSTLPDGTFYLKAREGLKVGSYSTKFKVHYTGQKSATAKCTVNVVKATLTVKYAGEVLLYNTRPKTEDVIQVVGFVNGENENSAEGYVAPTINLPERARETVVITPTDGAAENYDFEYQGEALTVIRRTAVAGKDGQYTVIGQMNENGWYVSDIVIKPSEGYQFLRDEDDKKAIGEIRIDKDSDDGIERFYAQDVKTGEIYKKTAIAYLRDTTTPEIAGIEDGKTYIGEDRKVTVTDNFLENVTINGVSQTIENGKSEFTLTAKTDAVYVITAVDKAGHSSSKKVTFEAVEEDTGLEANAEGRINKKAVIGQNAPTGQIVTDKKDLAENVLTKKELKEVNGGENADITLKVKNIDASVSQAEKELLIANLKGYTIGMYLDLTLFKNVSGGESNQLTELKRKIAITIDLPDWLVNEDENIEREFAVFCVHKGSVAFLPDQDMVKRTVTINSGEFSTYALCYRDVVLAAPKGDVDKVAEETVAPSEDGEDEEPVVDASEPSDEDDSDENEGNPDKASVSGGSTGSGSSGGSSSSTGSGGSGGSVPKSGDSMNLILWIIVCGLSFFGIGSIVAIKIGTRRDDF